MFQQVLVKLSNIKYHEALLNRYEYVPYGRTDIEDLIGAFSHLSVITEVITVISVLKGA
jgi:hypothetical protein